MVCRRSCLHLTKLVLDTSGPGFNPQWGLFCAPQCQPTGILSLADPYMITRALSQYNFYGISILDMVRVIFIMLIMLSYSYVAEITNGSFYQLRAFTRI